MKTSRRMVVPCDDDDDDDDDDDFDDNVDVFIFSCCVLIIRHATVNCILFARKRGPFHNVDVHDDNDDNNT